MSTTDTLTNTSVMGTDALQLESETFRAHQEDWGATHRGEFVLIRGSEFEFYPTLDAALNQGYELFDTNPFFVREVVEPERLEFISPQF